MEPISLSQGRLRSPLLRIQTDDRLARLAAAGEMAAYEVLVRRHRPALLRACSRILPDARAEDAVQQGLLSAQQALERNGAPERFEPWLHRIAVNAALKELQRASHDLPLDEERIDGVEQPAERFERRERLRTALAAIAALPEGQRRALVMRELEGRSHAEIARALGLSPGAARQLIHRARGTMRSAATALTPYGLLARMGGTETPSQAAEIVGGSGALAGKAVVTLVITGGIVGGVALSPQDSGPAAGVGKGDPTPNMGIATADPTQSASEDRERSDRRDGGDGHRSRESRDSDGHSSESDDGDSRDDYSDSGTSASGSDSGGEGDELESESSGSGSGSSGSGSSGSGSGSSESGGDGSD